MQFIFRNFLLFFHFYLLFKLLFKIVYLYKILPFWRDIFLYNINIIFHSTLYVVAFGHSKLSWPGNLLISSPGLSINKLSCKINYIIYKTVKDLATATKWRRLQYLLSPAALTYLPLIRSLPQICPAC